jgi:CBS domain-containing protein
MTSISGLITELRPIDLSLAETKPDLIAVSPVVSIETALSMMLKNKITSLPVFSHNDTEVVSIVNLFDILLYLLGRKKVIEKEKLRSQDPVELVLGLDTDRESYRVHKTDRKDKLIEVKHNDRNKGRENNKQKNRHFALLLLVSIEHLLSILKMNKRNHGFCLKLTSSVILSITLIV